MRKKPNEYGEVPKYEVDDRVRVWPIFKRPVGTVTAVFHEKVPISYLVRYRYEDGRVFEEEFVGVDLTLFEKYMFAKCNCHTHTWEHQTWCSAYRSIL